MVSSMRRLADHDRLEPALQRRVLLDVLAVLVERGRADHAQLAPGQHRLEHVAGVHRALALAGADDGVQLVEERDDLAVGVLDLLQDGLEPLLELAAVLRAGDHRAEVEGDQLLVAQRLGHVAGHDPLGQALDDRGLADAGLADQHRVVLGTPGQHLDDPADLGVPADHRVDLAVPGPRGQVDAVLLQRLVGLLRVGGGDPAVAAADAAGTRRPGASSVAPALLERVGHRAADPGQAGQQVLGGDVLVAERAGDLLGGADGVDELAGQARLGDAGAARGRQAARPPGRRPGGCRRGWRRRRAAAPAAVEPPVSSRASSRCHGSTVAWPRWLAGVGGRAVMTSRLLVVRRSAFMGSPDAASRTTPIALSLPTTSELSLFHSTPDCHVPRVVLRRRPKPRQSEGAQRPSGGVAAGRPTRRKARASAASATDSVCAAARSRDRARERSDRVAEWLQGGRQGAKPARAQRAPVTQLQLTRGHHARETLRLSGASTCGTDGAARYRRTPRPGDRVRPAARRGVTPQRPPRPGPLRPRRPRRVPRRRSR